MFSALTFSYIFSLFPSPDLNGIDLNPVQDTPVATRKEDTYIHFSVEVEIQKHLEKLPKGLTLLLRVTEVTEKIIVHCLLQSCMFWMLHDVYYKMVMIFNKVPCIN